MLEPMFHKVVGVTRHFLGHIMQLPGDVPLGKNRQRVDDFHHFEDLVQMLITIGMRFSTFSEGRQKRKHGMRYGRYSVLGMRLFLVRFSSVSRAR